MQKKAQPDTPVQRRSSARLLELPPASKGLTGEEKEKHGESKSSSPNPSSAAAALARKLPRPMLQQDDRKCLC